MKSPTEPAPEDEITTLAGEIFILRQHITALERERNNGIFVLQSAWGVVLSDMRIGSGETWKVVGMVIFGAIGFVMMIWYMCEMEEERKAAWLREFGGEGFQLLRDRKIMWKPVENYDVAEAH